MFETGLDPIAAALVRSLNRPEGNITGITSLNVAVAPKGLELLHELVPQANSFAVIVNPANPVNSVGCTIAWRGLCSVTWRNAPRRSLVVSFLVGILLAVNRKLGAV